jgi:hypothetical protein
LDRAVSLETSPRRRSGSDETVRRVESGAGGLVSTVDDYLAFCRMMPNGGMHGTSGYSDPKEDLVAILMTQCLWDSPSPPAVQLDFWTSVYQEIDD